MGKRKIGEIYNKPIVEGDINLKTPNEIHKSELSGGGASSGEVKEDGYVYMKLVNPFDDTSDEDFYNDLGSQFSITTIIGVPIDTILQNPVFMIYYTTVYNSVKSVAGSVYAQESGDGEAGLGGKLSPWDLSTTLNHSWTNGYFSKIRAIQFYKNTNTLGYSYSKSIPNPNYNEVAANDIMLRKIAEYCKSKLPEYFTEYEAINVYISVNLMVIGMLAGINMPDYAGVISYLDKLIEECKKDYTDLNSFLNMCSKKTFVEITKEEYDNICIDIMKNEITTTEGIKTLYEEYIAYNNQIEEMFKQ